MPNIDDTNSAVTYSGGWSVDGKVHSTSSTGSTATVRFTGSYINAFFTNPEGIGEIQASFTLNGREWTMDPRHRHYISYEDDKFFDSSSNLAGAISGSGPHTLIVRTVQGPLLLDYFVTDGTAVAPVVTQPTTSTNQRPAASSTQALVTSPVTTVVTQTQTVTNSLTSSHTSESSQHPETTSSGSGTSTSTTSTSGTTSSSVISQALSVDPSAGQTVTKFQVVTTSYSGVGSEVTLYPDGSGGFRATGAAKKTNLGVIIGAVVGSIVFLLLLVLLILLCIRRKRRAAAVRAQSAQDNEGADDMRESHLQRGASQNISAFALPRRISESMRAGAGVSKMRSHGHNRGFSRLEEGSDTATDTFYTSAVSTLPPSVTLNTYPNEKDTSLMDTIAEYGRDDTRSDTNTSTPSPLVSEGYLFSDAHSHYDVPPPAYHSGRQSALYPSGTAPV